MAWSERMSSGLYRGVYRNANGKRETVVGEDGKGFAGKREAKRAANDEEVKSRRRASRSTPGASMTWGEWWDRIAPERDKPETDSFSSEVRIVDKHLRPRWGDEPLNQITSVDVQRWVNDPDGIKPRRGLKASTARKIYGLFATTIRKAVRDGILDASPCAGIVLPPIPKQSNPILKEGDSANLDRDDYRDAVDFMLETGLRPNELCGLHVECLHKPRKGWVLVKHVFVTGKNVIRPWPKDLDERPVPLTPKALEIAERRLAGRNLGGPCGVPHVDGARCTSALVFLTERGVAMRPRSFRMYLSRRGMVTPYGGRRGQITRALDGGATPTDVAYMAGHSSLDQTADYWQVSDALRDRIIAALGQHEGLSVVEHDDTRVANRGANPRNTARPEGTPEAGESTG